METKRGRLSIVTKSGHDGLSLVDRRVPGFAICTDLEDGRAGIGQAIGKAVARGLTAIKALTPNPLGDGSCVALPPASMQSSQREKGNELPF